MKNQLKNLFMYLLLIISMLLTSCLSYSQIVYNDLSSDVSRSCTTAMRATGSCSTTYNIDLNNDSINDYSFIVSTSSHAHIGCSGYGCLLHDRTTSVYVTPLNGNAVAVDASAYPLYMNAGTNVQSGLTWSTLTSRTLRRGSGYTNISYTGNWITSTNGFVGLKFAAGGQTYYGWIRLSVAINSNTVSSNVIIRDFAYNSNPGNSIKALQSNTQNAYITTLAATPLCAGGNVSVPYSIIGTFNASNVFTVQLSDNNGSFNNPVTIGTLATASSGTINSLLPANIVFSTAYRMRIVSSNPAGIGPENGQGIIISNDASHPVISGSTLICAGSSIALTTTSVSGYTYQWLVNDTAISGATSYSRSVSTAGKYRCIVTSGCGPDTSNSITTTVITLPSAILTTTSNKICQGDSVMLSTGIGAGLTYIWKKGGYVIPGATNSTYYVNSAAYYTVVVTNASGCSATSANLSIYLSNSLPSSVITVNGSSTICQGGPGGYLSTLLVTGNVYQWMNNGVDIAFANGYYYTPGVAGDFSCRITNGCGTITSNVITFTVLPSPQAIVIASGSATFCNGSGVMLKANVYSGAYQWMKAGVDIPGAIDSFYYATSQDAYNVRETNSNGCVKTSNFIYTYYYVLTTSITVSGSLSICAGDSVLLSAGSGTAYTYQWKKNGVKIIGATQQYYYAKAAGSYKYTVTNSCGSKTSSTKTVTVTCRQTGDMALLEATDPLEINITPNPFIQSADIKWQLKQREHMTIIIFDLNGRIVKTLAEGMFEEGENEMKWNADDANGNSVKAGIYIIRMQSATLSATVKLIVTE